MIILTLIPLLIGISIFLIWYFNHASAYERISLQIGENTIEADLADTIAKRTKGLSGRKSLGENEGMFFEFPIKGKHGFWMKDMNFPIDIIWIADNKIIGVEENVDPQIGSSFVQLKTYYPEVLVNYVLEIASDGFKKLDIKIEDLVKINK